MPYTQMQSVSDSVSTSTVSLLCNRKFDTFALWQRDPWLLRSDNEDVTLTGCERVVNGILDVNDVETSIVTFTMSDNTDTAHVTTTGDHCNNTRIELDEIGDLASREINLDGVIDLNSWVRVTKGPSIVRDQEWDSTLSQLYSLDLAKFVFCLLSLDTVNGEAALDIVDQTEVLASLLDGDDIHEAGRVGGIGANLAIDLDQALHDDGVHLARVESIL